MTRYVFALGLLVVICAIANPVFVTASLTTEESPPQFRLPCGVVVVGVWETVEVEDADQTTTAAAGTRVGVFKSVRFARPPVGALRFRAPVIDWCPNTSSSPTVYNATVDRAMCAQQNYYGNATIGHEDCLSMTIRVPEAQLLGNNEECSYGGKKKKFPFLVYFFGGDLSSGNANHEPLSFFSANTPSHREAPCGVITAAANYRLGPLGWLAVQEMAEEGGNRVVGNWGLQDQIAAVKWLRANMNADNFTGDVIRNGSAVPAVPRGDVSRVTVMGQSSGGTAVLGLRISPEAGELISGGISLSGSPNISLSKGQKYRQDSGIVKQLGCNRGDADAVMKCLRHTATASQLTMAMPDSWNAPGVWDPAMLNNKSKGGLNLAGVIFVDGVLIPHGIRTALAMGINKHVALLFGSMGQEANFDSAYVDMRKYTLTMWHEWWTRNAFSTWGSARATSMSREITKMYRAAIDVNPQLAYFSVNGDYGIGCASPALALAAASGGAANTTYIYQNNYPPSKPNNNREASYAYHVWDYMAGIHDWHRYDYSFVPDLRDKLLSRQLRRHWGALIHHARLNSTEWPSAVKECGAAETSCSNATFFVFSRPDRYPFFSSHAVEGYKKEECDFYTRHGIGKGYWWCD